MWLSWIAISGVCMASILLHMLHLPYTDWLMSHFICPHIWCNSKSCLTCHDETNAKFKLLCDSRIIVTQQCLMPYDGNYFWLKPKQRKTFKIWPQNLWAVSIRKQEFCPDETRPWFMRRAQRLTTDLIKHCSAFFLLLTGSELLINSIWCWSRQSQRNLQGKVGGR